MGIMDLINKQKEKFRARQDAAREQKLIKTRAETVRAKKIISEKKEIAANEKVIQNPVRKEINTARGTKYHVSGTCPECGKSVGRFTNKETAERFSNATPIVKNQVSSMPQE